MAMTEALVEVNELFQRMYVLFIAIVLINEGLIVCLTIISDWIAERKFFDFIAEMLQVMAAFEKVWSECSWLPLLWTPSGVGGELVSVMARVREARVDCNQEITIVCDERRWEKTIIYANYVAQKGGL